MKTPNTNSFREILRHGASVTLVAFTVVVMAWLFSARAPVELVAETPRSPAHGFISSAQAAIAPMPAMSVSPVVMPAHLAMPAAGPNTRPKTWPLSYGGIADAAPLNSSASQMTVPAWRRYATLAPVPNGRPLVAIVIDDVGMTSVRSARAVALKAPVTLAFLPYAPGIAPLALEARRHGHEVMIHMPMEPLDTHIDPGPKALLSSLTHDALSRRIEWNFSQIEGYVGLNNHMGSRFTADSGGMELVMQEAAKRGLLYLDSRTTGDSRAPELAARYGVPLLQRDVFLDNVIESRAIRAQLDTLVRVAKRQGAAIAIGHPHAITLSVLERWLEVDHGVTFVPVSALADYDYDARRVSYDVVHDAVHDAVQANMRVSGFAGH